MKDGWLPITADRLNGLMAAVRSSSSPEGLLPRPGCVEGAIGNAVLAASYAQESDEPDILHVAAYLLRSLARDHCYLDGNKRVAWLACLEVLAVHAAVTVEADQDEAAELVERVAMGSADVNAAIEWLAGHLAPLA